MRVRHQLRFPLREWWVVRDEIIAYLGTGFRALKSHGIVFREVLSQCDSALPVSGIKREQFVDEAVLSAAHKFSHLANLAPLQRVEQFDGFQSNAVRL
jgi:hypothetical protein